MTASSTGAEPLDHSARRRSRGQTRGPARWSIDADATGGPIGAADAPAVGAGTGWFALSSRAEADARAPSGQPSTCHPTDAQDNPDEFS